MAAHIAIQKSPRPVQALFKHTEEHRRRGMGRLYDQGKPVDPSRGTLLFWVPGGMPLLLHVEASIAAAMKLRATTLTQEYSETAMEILGPWAQLMNDGHAPFDGRWSRQYLYDRSMTIAGGTTEVQRNIVAQRILGLPRN